MTYKVASIAPVWIFAIAGSILVGILSPADEYFTWVSMVFAVATIAAFGIQLFVPVQEGLVMRLMASVGGTVIILALATAVLALLPA
ncbi:hypothetical protein B0I08_1147 [Glaciihabitans tibetensis]|uniref:Uncharacterized protein n=1 Tax=Glaciihabitans tibetensis TaxID=1266600 RepID=A0A2T0V1L5_9MICO|nr:hypothetical protein [Glaciihabitans tibetensis]PRY64075.1 hypothetical protein B0I08_1147 [Glaciihabitans tibetensis]